MGVADEVLAILKTDNMKDGDRKKEIEVFFQEKVTDQTFNTLTVLASKITDYDPDERLNAGNGEERLEIDVDIEKEGESSSDEDGDMYVKDPELEEEKIDTGKGKDDDDNMSNEGEKVLQVSKADAKWIETQLQGYIKNQSKAKELFKILDVEKPEE